jgi:hypothetical protein
MTFVVLAIAVVLQLEGAAELLGGHVAVALVLTAGGAGLAVWPLGRVAAGPGARLRAADARLDALLFLTVGLFIPVLGLIGLAAALVVRGQGRGAPAQPARLTDPPQLPSRPLDGGQRARFGPGALEGLLRHASEPEARARVVLACRQLRTRSSVWLLRMALRDPVDDIRLLAYAVLDAREREIQVAIQALSAELGAAGERPAPLSVHARLAELYWELAYQELVEGELLAFCLQQVLDHAGRALTSPDMPRMAFLSGRALLRLGRSVEARARFTSAFERGLPMEIVGPYLAEAAFLERRPQEVRRQVATFAAAVRFRPILARIAEQWT